MFNKVVDRSVIVVNALGFTANGVALVDLVKVMPDGSVCFDSKQFLIQTRHQSLETIFDFEVSSVFYYYLLRCLSLYFFVFAANICS